MIGVREKITSLPFVPENNGIATFHFNNENSGSNYVSTRASITEDGQIIARHTAYGGNNFESTISFPVIKGKEYDITDRVNCIFVDDGVSNYVH